MIRHWVLVLALALGGPARAETARVYSGEHADFTRLVVELPATADWTLGRTSLGYAFAVGTDQQPGFDVSQVWDRIPKTRLQALWPDPKTGVLQLSLACACHVFPFEYQPGIIVLDIKPGPAPEGSAFEAAFAMPAAASLDQNAAAAPVYDWLALAQSGTAVAAANELDLATGNVSLDPLRTELLLEISRGAAQGVVDMALPGKPPDLVPAESGTLPWSQIHIGPPPDTRIESVADGKDARTPEGSACVPDTELALADWGSDQDPLDLLAEARSDLYGELDLLNPEKVERAVRSHLYLGFGAEAAQYAQLLPLADAPDVWPYLQSLALLVDGNSDPQSPFLDMLACEGAAALWALMAQPAPPSGVTVNDDAIVRSFLALPPHLRASLGAVLAEKLLGHGETEAARIVRNAVERTPDVLLSTVALLDAEAELHHGSPDQALDHAETAVSTDGDSVEQWIALVEAHFRATKPLPTESVEVIRAFEGDVEGAEKQHEFYRALALAEVLAGQTATGLGTARHHGILMTDIWQAATTLADDDSFLREALAAGDHPGADINPETSLRVAERLADLGFPDAALAWLGPTAPEDGPEWRRVAALSEFARGDARQTLALLSGLNDPEDAALKAKALVQLGRIPEARAAYLAADMPDEALRLAAWEGEWADLQDAGSMPWAGALADLASSAAEPAGPLARGAATLEASAASRASISALLAGIAVPES